MNFIHAKDASKAILKCIKYKKLGIFNIGGKKTLNFFKIANMIKKKKNSKSKIFLKQDKLYRTLNKLDVNIKKSKRILNWQPNIEFKKGLQMVINKQCI